MWRQKTETWAESEFVVFFGCEKELTDSIPEILNPCHIFYPLRQKTRRVAEYASPIPTLPTGSRALLNALLQLLSPSRHLKRFFCSPALRVSFSSFVLFPHSRRGNLPAGERLRLVSVCSGPPQLKVSSKVSSSGVIINLS